MPATPHTLYRFYSADGTLLYVGISVDPGSRWKQHRDEKPWWHEVRGISMETYPSREEVLAAERRAIAVENPRHNKQRPALPRSSADRSRVRELVWVCDACRLPIADGAGYIHVLHVEINTVRDAERAWRDEHERPTGAGGLVLTPASAWLDYPHPARWQVHHAACDPDPYSADYWIDVKRIRTHADLLARTAHLMGKKWMKHTNWLELIERMSRVHP